MTLARCFGVFGDPISHSRSPRMHDAAFAQLGLPHRYLPFVVPRQRLQPALAGAAELGMGGVNLTVPLKQDAVPLMDRLTPQAAAIGAVNTVIWDDGVRVGHNTDGDGFVLGLKLLPSVTLDVAVVLGGGGAARAVVDSLVRVGAEVYWVSRAPDRLPAWDKVRPTGYETVDDALSRASLLVNTTTVGMVGGPSAFPRPIELARLPSHAAVVDVVYPRPPHGLLAAAQACGRATQDGLAMLWGQGVLALQEWLQMRLPRPVQLAMAQAIGLSVRDVLV